MGGVDKAITDYLSLRKNELKRKNEHSAEKDDDTDQFMKAMATSIRKLPPRVRAEVKYKIHGLVHDAEMTHLFPAENDDQHHFNTAGCHNNYDQEISPTPIAALNYRPDSDHGAFMSGGRPMSAMSNSSSHGLWNPYLAPCKNYN